MMLWLFFYELIYLNRFYSAFAKNAVAFFKISHYSYKNIFVKLINIKGVNV